MRALPFVCGTVPYVTACAVVAARFVQTSRLQSTRPDGSVARMPDFVTPLVVGELALFSLFAFNMLGQIVAPPSRYRVFEFRYIVLIVN